MNTTREHLNRFMVLDHMIFLLCSKHFNDESAQNVHLALFGTNFWDLKTEFGSQKPQESEPKINLSDSRKDLASHGTGRLQAAGIDWNSG